MYLDVVPPVLVSNPGGPSLELPASPAGSPSQALFPSPKGQACVSVQVVPHSYSGLSPATRGNNPCKVVAAGWPMPGPGPTSSVSAAFAAVAPPVAAEASALAGAHILQGLFESKYGKK